MEYKAARSGRECDRAKVQLQTDAGDERTGAGHVPAKAAQEDDVRQDFFCTERMANPAARRDLRAHVA